MALKNELTHKSAVQVSGNTVERYREPTNPLTKLANTQFIFDHKKQMAVIPDNKPHVLIEARQREKRGPGYMAMNKHGRSAAFGADAHVELGGIPDDPGLRRTKGRKA